MKIVLIGPVPLAGIAQAMLKYKLALETRGHQVSYVQYNQKIPEDADRYMIFAIPIAPVIDLLPTLKNCTIMTVTETERVHSNYDDLPRRQVIYVPSEFSCERLEKQFPARKFSVLRHWTPIPKVPCSKKMNFDGVDYVFYTIGNMKDPRKNLRMLLEAFVRLQLPGAHLLIKASCLDDLRLNFSWVTVVNAGVISDEDIDIIHASGDCYVSCSHSEGVGLGAVEAAVRDKPVIMSDYGGGKEYVKTPFMIECDVGPIGFDDFLYSASMEWGHPKLESLMEHMKYCYEKRIRTWDHSYTKTLMDSVPPLLDYIVCNPVHSGGSN